ncbi:MAG: DUF488 domain-containing protein [Anaerolineae bacterium]|nr:DUF488 domain-containing protein [Anaerolineae bacterium]
MSDRKPPSQSVIYTIGHSNHTTRAFVDLLQKSAIDIVVDVRSQPYSQWAPQFNRESLRDDLQEARIRYVFMGDVLGGRPGDPALYDPGQGRPNYRRMEQTPAYQAGIDRLLTLAEQATVVVMCSEGDYRQCHRHLLVSQTLLARGAQVHHVHPDGAISEGYVEAEQLSLFG